MKYGLFIFTILLFPYVLFSQTTITVSVDMNGYPNSFNGVYISGTFNNWSGTATPLSDADQDGIWSGTLSLQRGNYEYLFTLDNKSVEEQFSAGLPCLSNTNRLLSVGTAPTEACYQWNSCEACETLGCLQLAWSDEFTGTSLNNNNWTPQIGDACPSLCGWGNNELEYYRSENAVVTGGKLKIIAKEENFGGRSYTSARIRSINKGDWTYGRFEASIKLPEGQGIWPAFWMLPTDEEYSWWPQSGEIDIMEYLGHQTNRSHGTIHYGPQWPNNKFTGNSYQLPTGGFHEDFHVFAIEWDQNVIKWYVDDFLYATITAADIAPEHWPFDQRFHFILNVAVGGNWPGNPDASTVFPQTMEVDYVRVYKGRTPSITGNLNVLNDTAGEVYTVADAPAGTTYNWSVPVGATLVAGQGTSSITVNWGDVTTSGTVEVTLGGNICTAQTIQQYVRVAAQQVLENFDLAATISSSYFSGILQENLNNPSPNAVNGSTLVGKYTRNAAEQYDVLIYDINQPINPADLVTGNEKFYLDIYSNAPIGTSILLQLEDDSATNGTNYPAGRHSRYQGATTLQNAWERIAFNYLDRPDAGVAHIDVDKIVLLFAPNSNNGSMYYFDNFEISCVNSSECSPTHTCVNSINIPQNGIATGIYRATDIFSQGTVANGSNVQFLAANSVSLQPGFEVVNGAVFLANIEACTEQFQAEPIEQFFSKIPLNSAAKETKKGIRVFPNPTHHQITIQLQEFEEGELQLLDATGKVLITKTVFDTYQVDMRSFSPGIFFLQVRDRYTGKVFTRKVINQQ